MKKCFILKPIQICCIAAFFILSDCTKNPLNIDVSEIHTDIKIRRLDRELFLFHPDSLEQHLPELGKKYGEFLNLYTNRIITIGDPSAATYTHYFRLFLTDYMIQSVARDVSKKFQDLSNTEKEIDKAFRHYKYYYPDKPVPAVITYVGGFNQSIVTADTLLGIGLDKYLGEKSSYYESLQISNYLRKQMIPERIPVDAVRAWALMEFPADDSVNNLISNMLYFGKIQYFIDAMLPKLPDTLKLGYSHQQLIWCKKYEQDMWKFLIDKKLLFETNKLEIARYTGEAPFTTTFGKNSPPKTGIYIGWRIITSYMNHNKNISLQKLMEEKDVMKILNFSRYKP